MHRSKAGVVQKRVTVAGEVVGSQWPVVGSAISEACWGCKAFLNKQFSPVVPRLLTTGYRIPVLSGDRVLKRTRMAPGISPF